MLKSATQLLKHTNMKSVDACCLWSEWDLVIYKYVYLILTLLVHYYLWKTIYPYIRGRFKKLQENWQYLTSVHRNYIINEGIHPLMNIILKVFFCLLIIFCNWIFKMYWNLGSFFCLFVGMVCFFCLTPAQHFESSSV